MIIIFLISFISVFSSYGESLNIIYTNNLEGYVDTCGCAVTPGGGVVRRLNLYKKLNLSPDTTLYLDAGDALSFNESFQSYEKAKMEKAADIIMKHFKLLNIDAFTLGEKDLAFDLKFIERLVKSHKIPIVVSNSEINTFNKPVKLTRGGKKIGILGILSDKFANVKTLKLKPAIPVLKKAVTELKKNSDIIILLAHCEEEELNKILKEIKGIDIVVSAHIQEQLTAGKRINDTIILRMLSGGDSVGVLEYDKLARIAKNRIFFLGNEYSGENKISADVKEYEKLQSKGPADSEDIDDNF